MLQMKAACEHCQRRLDWDSEEARICSYECTFCVSCVTGPLQNRCPNCQGELVARPRRAKRTQETGVE
jgi:uncharacterized protein